MMVSNDNSTAKAFFIENTRTQNRRYNLYDVALYIEKQRNKLGSLEKVSKEVAGVSVNMLNRFLSVLKVDKKILPFIKERKIDNINALYYIQKLSPEEQFYIASSLAEKKINSADVRALIPLRKRFPHQKINDLLKEIVYSKNQKRYLVKYEIKSSANPNLIKKRLSEFINKNEFSISTNNRSGEIYLSNIGHKTLENFLTKNKISYSDFFKSILIKK